MSNETEGAPQRAPGHVIIPMREAALASEKLPGPSAHPQGGPSVRHISIEQLVNAIELLSATVRGLEAKVAALETAREQPAEEYSDRFLKTPKIGKPK